MVMAVGVGTRMRRGVRRRKFVDRVSGDEAEQLLVLDAEDMVFLMTLAA
jgi:hypothetical protein